jgi:hypothetical protein
MTFQNTKAFAQELDKQDPYIIIKTNLFSRNTTEKM